MYTDRDSHNKVSIGDLTITEAELIQTAALRLVEMATISFEHAKAMRRLAMQLDKTLREDQDASC